MINVLLSVKIASITAASRTTNTTLIKKAIVSFMIAIR
jgi:hypothetical protein